MTDLCHQPAHELVRLMSDRTVSCREVIEAHLARIDAVNAAPNAPPRSVSQCGG
jgi:amidase